MYISFRSRTCVHAHNPLFPNGSIESILSWWILEAAMVDGWRVKGKMFQQLPNIRKKTHLFGDNSTTNADIAENQLDAQNPANQLTWYIPSIDCRFHRSKLLKILFMNSTPITS